MYEDIVAFPFKDEGIPVNIEAMGISYCDETYTISREKSDVYVLEYILRGKGTLINEKGIFTPCHGDVYLLKKGEKHTYYSDAAEPWEKIWINVRGRLMDFLINAYGMQDVTYIPNANCPDLFEKLYKTCRLDIGYKAIFYQSAIIIHEIFSRLSQTLFSAGRVDDEATNIKAILDQCVEDKITLAELADRAHLSVSQTIRIFKQAFQKTPYDYLLERRIELAKILLLSSRLSVKEIGYRLKFADEHYFSGFFKKKVLLSPKAFRNMQGK